MRKCVCVRAIPFPRKAQDYRISLKLYAHWKNAGSCVTNQYSLPSQTELTTFSKQQYACREE